MAGEPRFSLVSDFIDDFFGKGVGKTPSDEDEDSILVPMGEAKAMFLDRFFGIEKHGLLGGVAF